MVILKQHSRTSRLLALAALLLASVASPALPQLLPGLGAAPAAGQASSRAFPETGKTVQGKFLSYWNTHGGLAQQGYPVSEEMQEKSDIDGKTYTVQYFERAVFEYHPENKAPYDVLLSQLGTTRYKAVYSVRHLDTFEEVWGLVRDRYVYTDFRGLNWQAMHDEYDAKLKTASSDEADYDIIVQMIEQLKDSHS